MKLHVTSVKMREISFMVRFLSKEYYKINPIIIITIMQLWFVCLITQASCLTFVRQFGLWSFVFIVGFGDMTCVERRLMTVIIEVVVHG